jgi:hypothetical protein
LNLELLPTKSYWLEHEADKTSSGTTKISKTQIIQDITSNIGKKQPIATNTSNVTNKNNSNSTANNTTNSNNNNDNNNANQQSLKRLHLRGQNPLVIEILDDVQNKIKKTNGSFKVWVQKLLNPDAKVVFVLFLFFLMFSFIKIVFL